MILYIVIGVTGNYEDRHQWLVKAYNSLEDAELHVKRCEQWFEENIDMENEDDWDGIFEGENPYDPHMSVDYNGTHWIIKECEYDG